ncbi:MAG: methyl-accepting chemotaxis protein [Vicinamibacterales bacterium]
MQKMTIGKRLALGFGTVIAIVSILGAYTFYELRTIQAASDRVVLDALPGTALTGAITASVKTAYAEGLEHVAATDKAIMDESQKAILVIRADLGKKYDDYQKTITTEEDRANFEKIAPLRKQFLTDLDAMLALSTEGKKNEAMAYFQQHLKPTYEQYDAAVGVLRDWNAKNGQDAGQEIGAAVSQTTWGVLLGVGLAILGGLAIAALIIRTISAALRASVTTLKDGAQQVSSASTQVASSAQSLSQGASEQAASIEETSASMEEMSSMSRQNAENTRNAESLIVTVDGKVAESNRALTAMVASMSSIKESSDNISRIIKTIDEIAFQTNILALNAAVEAARAGEAGMGFAVVADEVRSLAQRSAEAAKNTANLIEQSIARSNEGTHRVEEMAGSIRAITDAVSEVKRLVEAVSTATAQQAQGFDQVSQAIAQMEKVTQTNAATAEESAAASEELNAQAEASLSAVTEIEALVGGSAQVVKPVSAQPNAAPKASRFSLHKRAA